MALAIKPENIVSYFGNIVCPFRTNYLDNNYIKVYHAYAIKRIKFIINNTLAIVFNAEFLSYYWRLLMVDKKIQVFFFALKMVPKFVL